MNTIKAEKIVSLDITCFAKLHKTKTDMVNKISSPLSCLDESLTKYLKIWYQWSLTKNKYNFIKKHMKSFFRLNGR